MTINDDILSAFLDGELSAHEMAAVQDAIANDAEIANRFEQLASVNALVQKQAALIDQVPMPAAVLALLQGNDAKPANNVVELSAFRKAKQQTIKVLREHAALAASIALVVGFAGGQWLSDGQAPVNDGISAQFAALDITASGQQVALSDGSALTTRFSFIDTSARFCRQYQVQDSTGSSENLACRDQSGWELVASARSSALSGMETYTPASGPRLLDGLLDVMMSGQALDQAEEQTAISNQWRIE